MGQKVTCHISRIKNWRSKLGQNFNRKMILFSLFLVSDARFLQTEECLSNDQSLRCAADCETDYSRKVLLNTFRVFDVFL